MEHVGEQPESAVARALRVLHRNARSNTETRASCGTWPLAIAAGSIFLTARASP